MPITYSASRPNCRAARFDKPKLDMDLLASVELFLRRHRHLTEGKFGCLSCGNYYIVRAIRKGATLMPKTETSIRTFMARYVAPSEAVAMDHGDDEGRVGVAL